MGRFSHRFHPILLHPPGFISLRHPPTASATATLAGWAPRAEEPSCKDRRIASVHLPALTEEQGGIARRDPVL